MTQGDIVITNYPFTSFKGLKIRPALIISNDKFNEGEDRILLAISTKSHLYSMKIHQTDIAEGSLQKESYIRFSNIISAYKGLLMRKIGKLDKKSLKIVIEKVSQLLE